MYLLTRAERSPENYPEESRQHSEHGKSLKSWIASVTHTVYRNNKLNDTYLQVFLLFFAHYLKLLCHLHLSDPLSFLSLAAQLLTVFFSQSIQCCTGIFHLCQFILQSFIIHCDKNIELISEKNKYQSNFTYTGCFTTCGHYCRR